MPNRRKRSRVRGSYEGILALRGKEWPVLTRDISLKGALISASVLPPLREECTLRIPLSDDIALEMEGIIVRVGSDDAAMDFTGMDEETYAHLSTMVRLRVANADLVDREELEEPFD
jgi:hypothetical protein